MTSEVLKSHIASVRSKHVLVSIATGVVMIIALIVLWTGISMWIDWHVARGLPQWGRALSLALELVAIAAIIVFRIVQPIRRGPDDEDIALMIEHDWPDFKTRLIAAVQLTQPAALAELAGTGGGRALVGAMVHQAEEMADQTPVTDVVKTRTLNWIGIASGLLVALAVFLFLFEMPASGALLTRAMLGNTPLPTKTHIESSSGDLRAALGDPLKIEVKVSGYKPAAGTLEMTYASGRVQRLPMDRENNSDTYAITLDSVQESFKYSVTVYDGVTDDFAVTALERPAVASLECFQAYPAYTGLATVPCPSGELALLKGSTLKVRVLSTKPVRSNIPGSDKNNYVLCFSDSKDAHDDKIPLWRDAKNLRLLTAEIPLSEGLNAISIHLVDTDGLESKDTAVYPVEIIPDRAPTIKIVAPDRKEVLQTAIAKLKVGFLAEDDYMVGTVTLHYKIDENPSILSISLQVPPNQRDPLRRDYLWDLGKIPPPIGQPSLEGSVVEYWLDVEDTRTKEFGGPGKGTSEHYAVRVVTEAAKRAELAARSGQTVGDIKEAEEHQTESADKTVTLIHEIPGAVAPTVPSPRQP